MNFVMLIGPPCSGKSTYVENNLDGYKVLSTDNLIQKYADEDNLTYDYVFNTVPFSVFEKQMFEELNKSISSGDNIVVDRTNMTKKSRNKFLSKVPDSYHTVAVVFDNDLDTLFERNKERSKTGKSIPEFVIRKMLYSYEYPDEFQEIIHV